MKFSLLGIFIVLLGALYLPSLATEEGLNTKQASKIKSEINEYKKTLKEKKTTLLNKKYEIELIEEVNEDSPWDSWPVGATVYDDSYDYCYSITLDGSELRTAFLQGDYLYALVGTLGSTYSSDVFESVWLHGWGESKEIKDVEDGEISPDKRWFIYAHYLGRGTFFSDDLGLERLGDNYTFLQPLTGCDHPSSEMMLDNKGNLVSKKFNWSSGLDRSKTWKRLSNFLWDKKSETVFFVVGEKGILNKDETLKFSGIFLVKLSVPSLMENGYKPKNIAITFSTKPIQSFGDFGKLTWSSLDKVLIDFQGKKEDVSVTNFDAPWVVPNEKPCAQEEE